MTSSATAWRGSAAADQALADQHRVGAGRGVLDQVVRPPNAGFGDLDDAARQAGRDPLEGRSVDLERVEVAGVDADDPGAGVQRAAGLVLGVHLDERGHAERFDALAQPDQGVLVEGGDDQQHHVGAVGPGLVHLVGPDDEVLAQDRHRHLGPHRVEVGERAAEVALLGEHADDARAAGLVFGGRAGPDR